VYPLAPSHTQSAVNALRELQVVEHQDGKLRDSGEPAVDCQERIAPLVERRGYSVNCRKMTVALWPPSPKLLLIAARTLRSRASFGA
jgi:hypothetical protein